ncbi:MAG: site-2 protease family protein [Acidobacteria bacterium]|nr:site-2 protease family protein [Acidobacteriota bacterium]
MSTTNVSVLPPEPAPPEVIHSCPSCSHWLTEGTLACPDCQTLTYGVHLGQIAHGAQQLEQEQKWAEARDRWNSALVWLPEGAPQTEGVRQHIAQIDARLKAEQDKKAKWTKRLGPFAPIALFLMKIKSALFLLFKLKFLLSLFAFFGIYWALFGWQFALGFTVCLFVHEMGHFIAVKRRGLKADLPIFLPMMGAYVRWYSQGVSLEDLAAISLAGPMFGLLAAGACYGLFLVTHQPIFMVLVYVGAWVNFLNLVPVLGMDGAQATFALSKLQRGLVATTCLVLFGLTITGGDLFGETTQWIFLIVGLGMVWRCFTRDEPEKPSTRTFLYFQTLIVVLGAIVYKTQFAGMGR